MTHTPELEFDHDDFCIYTHGGATVARVLEFSDFPCADAKDGQNINDAQAVVGRLLAAAYNSYDKNFGPRAVEAAEGDELGRLIKENRILLLAAEPEDELQNKIDEMRKDIQFGQGVTDAGVARLLIKLSEKIAADAVEIQRLRRACTRAYNAEADLLGEALAYVERMAIQRKHSESTEEEQDGDDWEGGFDNAVEDARYLLSKSKGVGK